MAFDDVQIYPGSVLGKKHKVEALLGEGGYGVVTKCRNLETDKMVAVKINKVCPGVALQTRKEIDILRRLRCLNPDTCNLVRSEGFFFANSLICLVFELLDQSLYDYMKDRQYCGLPMTELQPIVHQLATALTHLSSLGIVHADVKPDNIMVVDRRQQPLDVKLIDFGLAHPTFAAKTGSCLQTIWYRAPEIMLHIPYNEAIDMWSLGLVAAELATGYPLYPGDTEYDMMNFIIKTQGQPADDVLNRGECTTYYFQYDDNNEQHWRFKTEEDFVWETGCHFTDFRTTKLTCLDDLRQLMTGGQWGHQRLLVDLIKRMMELDADQRIKPLEALQHPFFAPILPQSDPVCSDMDVEMPGVEHQSPPCCVTGAEIINHSVESGTVSPAVEAKDTAEVDAPAKKNCWFRRFFRWVKGSFRKRSKRS